MHRHCSFLTNEKSEFECQAEGSKSQILHSVLEGSYLALTRMAPNAFKVFMT